MNKAVQRREPAMCCILPKEATQDFFCKQHRPWDSAVNQGNSFVAVVGDDNLNPIPFSVFASSVAQPPEKSART
jgi:hypothetical protein